MSKRNVNIDIMVNERFYKTLHLRCETSLILEGEAIEECVDLDEVREKVLSLCPSLKEKNYRICL